MFQKLDLMYLTSSSINRPTPTFTKSHNQEILQNRIPNMRALINLYFLCTFLVGAAMAGSLRLRILPAPYQNLTTTQLHQILLHTSISRAARFKTPASFIPPSPSPLPSRPFTPVESSYGGLFYVEILIGTPPLRLNLAIDTASSPTWVQSANCRRCFKVTTPSFNASKSSTFRRMHSDDGLCIPDFLYPQGKFCGYEVQYAVNQVTKGEFGYDSLFSDDTQLAFGRGFYNGMIDFKGERKHPNKMAGILGLGRDHPSSLVHQLSSVTGMQSQFAYRLPVHSRDQGFLIFGDEAELKGPGVKSTPILGNPDDFYYLNMTGISVNGSILPINRKLFKSDEQGVVIDSGSQYSLFVPEAYQTLQDAIVNYFYPWAPLPQSKSGFDLCYDLDQVSQVEGSVLEQVPPITFHFEGADLQLKPDTSFKVFEDMNELCLMMLPIKEPLLPNIIGGFQQLRYWFQFDLRASKISFVPEEY